MNKYRVYYKLYQIIYYADEYVSFTEPPKFLNCGEIDVVAKNVDQAMSKAYDLIATESYISMHVTSVWEFDVDDYHSEDGGFWFPVYEDTCDF